MGHLAGGLEYFLEQLSHVLLDRVDLGLSLPAYMLVALSVEHDPVEASRLVDQVIDGTAQAKYGFGVEGSELRAAYTGFMSFYSGGYSGTESMRIDANGKVGAIG